MNDTDTTQAPSSMDDFGPIIGQISGLNQQQADLAKEFQPKMAAATEGVRTAMADEQKAAADVPTPLKPPPVPDQQLKPMAGKTAVALIAAALLGGRATRTPWLSASIALGAATKAYNNGQLEQMKLNMQKYDKELASIKEQNSDARQRYEDILKSKTLSVTDKMTELDLLAKEMGIPQDAINNQEKTLESQIRIMDGIQSHKEAAAARAEAEKDRLFIASQAHQDRVAALSEKKSEAQNKDDILTPEGVESAAQTFYLTGSLPSGLTRSPKTTGQIINRAAEIAKENGDTGQSSALRKMANKANQTALNQLVKQQQLVGAYEKNAVKNADLALSMSDKVGRTGVPVVNRWVNAGRKATGDVDVANFDAANNSFVTEYAKVMSGGYGAAQTSDTATNHARDLLSTAMTPDQYKGVIQTLKTEMSNRMSGFNEQRQELMSGVTGDEMGGETTSKKIIAHRPAQDGSGRTEVKYEDGSTGYQ